MGLRRMSRPSREKRWVAITWTINAITAEVHIRRSLSGLATSPIKAETVQVGPGTQITGKPTNQDLAAAVKPSICL